jgi:hypothetical protein
MSSFLHLFMQFVLLFKRLLLVTLAYHNVNKVQNQGIYEWILKLIDIVVCVVFALYSRNLEARWKTRKNFLIMRFEWQLRKYSGIYFHFLFVGWRFCIIKHLFFHLWYFRSSCGRLDEFYPTLFFIYKPNKPFKNLLKTVKTFSLGIVKLS